MPEQDDLARISARRTTGATGERPGEAGFHMPAEWSNHAAVWLAWPSHRELWESHLSRAQAEFVDMCRAIQLPAGPQGVRGERLEVLVRDEDALVEAQVWLAGLEARYHEVPYGDIWLRDTGPTFVVNEPQGGAHEVAAVHFEWNGWGEKYLFPEDLEVTRRIGAVLDIRPFDEPWVLEGGAIEVDGEGTVLTTEQCLRNRNRGRAADPIELLEADLRAALGAESVRWLRRGLLNDHTDGHIDTLARFVAPGVVVCMEPRLAGDPNREILVEIRKALTAMRDARGRRLEVFVVPSPGEVCDGAGALMPASYVNFYIANHSVVVPTYGTLFDEETLYRLEELFPGRSMHGVSGRAILEGGGAFHCITQQQPSVPVGA